jgi:membrane-associated protease RseP (regulator of RpoE activity)
MGVACGPMLLGAAVLLVGALANVLAFLGSRYALALWWGGSGGLFALGMKSDWPSTSTARRLAFAAAGPFTCYFIAVGLFATGTLVGGKVVLDETSMRVNVAPDGAAAKAGLRDDDRIVSVDSEPIHDWPTLKQKVGAHPNEEIRVTVERDGRELALSPTPDAAGKILVGPPSRVVDVGLGKAVLMALVEPVRVNVASFESWIAIFVGRETELSGPVGIVKATQKARGNSFATLLRFVGMLESYFLWVPVLVALVLFPRLAAKRPSAG